MSFLSPMTAAIAAGLTIPPLVALYFLKLKRAIRPVPSTLLWKRAVEDLHVNAPFQRLRASLLLLLQLLVLLAAALALGKPMLQTAQTQESTIVILIDQSASMGVVEEDGRTRLEAAKAQAKQVIDNMADDARAMVIAFCDRAAVESSFDTDRRALKQKIDAIEQTQSRSSLGEAMSLAEAYTQTIILGGDQAGADVAPESPAPPASVFLFTDGRIEDADRVALQKFDVEKIQVANIGRRADNVGIIAMEARRNYERPDMLEVAATVENFGATAVSVDAVLRAAGELVDVKTVTIAAPRPADTDGDDAAAGSLESNAAVVVFDDLEFGGGGVIEVTLSVDDALAADDRAWTIVPAPRHIRALLVTEGNLFLERLMSILPIELVKMSPDAYEAADLDEIQTGDRSAFDVVVMDRHSTDRLPKGNYFFWGAVPQLEGVSAGKVIDDEVIFNWDDAHPILRHVSVETLFVYQWLDLSLPPEAVSLIEGEHSPVLALFTRNASQFLVSAFSLIVEDDRGNPLMNTYWVTSVDFIVLVQNAINYLSSNIVTSGRSGVTTGEPVTLPLPERADKVKIRRPDNTYDNVLTSEDDALHYSRTRLVGTYRVEPSVEGHDVFAVNLFNRTESRVAPKSKVTLGADMVETKTGSIELSEPAWPYFLLALLVLLVLEWIIYNRRIFV